MQITRGYKTELRLTREQERLFAKACGIARFAYNWGLERNNNVWLYNQLPHEPVKYESPIDQHRTLNSKKAVEFSWMYEVSKCVPQEALRDLGKAFHNFLVRRDRFGWPRFKSRHDDRQSFTLTGSIRVTDRAIKLPRLRWVKLKERGYLPAGRHVLSATVSRRAGRWFVSVGVRKRTRMPDNHGPVVGVDWGVSHLVTLSDGTIIEGGRPLRRLQRGLKHVQKELSRRQKGSSDRAKTLLRLQKLHWRVANVRNDELHKLTTMLARTKSVVVIEDLAVQNMTKNHRLAGAILDGAPAELRQMLEYKTRWYGSRLVVAPRKFPSTKRCSGCGNVKEEMPLSERVYRCEVCGLVIDRDLNAARNLEWYVTASSAGCACLMQEVTGPRGPVPAGEAGRVHSTWSKWP